MWRWRRSFVLAVTVLLTACAASKPSASEPAVTIDPMNLYPLRIGNAWSYDVDTGDSTTTLAVTRVESAHGALATVRTGDATVTYEVRDEGVYVVSEDAWLFREPFDEGSTWPARGGRTGRVVTTAAGIETPAGRFQGCLEVRETGGTRGLVVTTIYCPFVGPVSVESTMPSDVSNRTASARAELRGYTVDRATVTP